MADRVVLVLDGRSKVADCVSVNRLARQLQLVLKLVILQKSRCMGFCGHPMLSANVPVLYPISILLHLLP
jgi:hypothetical protein